MPSARHPRPMQTEALRFDRPVPHNGYGWWYVDGISEDRQHAITLIAFVGSVFSPYYALSRRTAAADPENFCALNVAVYSPGKARWSMTERNAAVTMRSEQHFQLGPSKVSWNGETLEFEIDEVTCPIPRRLQGTVRVRPSAVHQIAYPLEDSGRHLWCPIAPVASIEVDLVKPSLRWRGRGYIDANFGDDPLERAFSSWYWMRASVGSGTRVHYVTQPLAGRPTELSVLFGADGQVSNQTLAPEKSLGRSRWGIPMAARNHTNDTIQLVRRLEDTPFYSRSLLTLVESGEPLHAIHETLSVSRFQKPIVQAMLPFRMPRSNKTTR